MILVLDASAVGSFLLPDEDAVLGAFAWELCRTEQLLAPPIWRTEVANLILKAFRRGRINAMQCADAALRADQVASVVSVGAEMDVAQIHAVATDFQLSAYDATYFNLAHRLRLPLLTGDGGLIRAAQKAGIELLRP